MYAIYCVTVLATIEMFMSFNYEKPLTIHMLFPSINSICKKSTRILYLLSLVLVIYNSLILNDLVYIINSTFKLKFLFFFSYVYNSIYISVKCFSIVSIIFHNPYREGHPKTKFPKSVNLSIKSLVTLKYEKINII